MAKRKDTPVGFVPWNPARHTLAGWVEESETGCHIWVGSKDRRGYGQVTINRRKLYVHRIRYEREIGPIPEGDELDHFACDNGKGGCCNPHHCRPVTHRENMMRSNSISAKNRAVTHCPQGHEYTKANTWVSSRNQRYCRSCNREKAFRLYHREGDR